MFYYGVHIIPAKAFKDSELQYIKFKDYTEYLTYKFNPEWIIFEADRELHLDLDIDLQEFEQRFLQELKKTYI